MSFPQIRFSGAVLSDLSKKFPRFVFTSGIHIGTGRYGVFVYDRVEKGTNLPPIGVGELCFLETCGASEKDIEVLYAKIALIHG